MSIDKRFLELYDTGVA